MPKGVRADPLALNAGTLYGLADRDPYRALGHGIGSDSSMSDVIVGAEQHAWRGEVAARPVEVGTYVSQRVRRDGHTAILAALSLANPQDGPALLPVHHVADGQAHDLRDSQPGADHDGEQRLVPGWGDLEHGAD